MLTPCTGRSLAVHIALPSATGNASRRYCCVLAGRSLAAILPSRPICVASRPAFPARPSAISENRKRSDGSSRARSAATRSLLMPFRERTDFSWLSRQICGRVEGRSRNVACEMQRAGLEPVANWRVSHRARRKRAEPARATGGAFGVPERKDGEARRRRGACRTGHPWVER